MQLFSVHPVNESSILLRFGNSIDVHTHQQLMQAKHCIEQNPFLGFVETVPAYNTLAVYFNPVEVEQTAASIAASVEESVRNIIANAKSPTASTTTQLIEIPVCYNEDFAPDLAETAGNLRLSTEALIQLHCSKTYHVYMLGFTPGFPYMGKTDERIVTKRKQQPRLAVAPGSVAIAGEQTGIYPFATPGGWNIIGRTPLQLFDRHRTNPFLLKAGDEVQFKPITPDEFEQYSTSDAPVGRELKNNITHLTKTSDDNKPSIQVEQCGFLTTLQDTGRTGYLQYGVSKGGAMDSSAAQLANVLVGNDADETVLELTQSPHRFVFTADTVIAFTGGGLQPETEQQLLPLHKPLFIAAGTVVHCRQQLPGFRLYMAVAGGFAADEFLQSSSTDLLIKAGGFDGRPLKKADILAQKNKHSKLQQQLLQVLKAGATIELFQSNESMRGTTIRVLKGAEWNYLTDASSSNFTQQAFTVTQQSNRMGYRLKTETLQTNQSCDIVSSPVTQGTVQLTSSGEMIILMADAQTVGGYPRIAQVCAADLSLLAQKKPGDAIQFQIVSLQEAEALYMKRAEELKRVQDALASLVK
ncbi:KipI family sensor histidine kinase inhibitor [Lacibacter cauensis]|uniref:KipI family sensor histidine kinase inhibitor n=1 Tax=Lacibacter cauensis TaxID=510947 RepID=A0A562SHD4_9BACT|nr:5-oxoprolinase subunit PxpB [Lacibacter cauensis]TWI80384.1 KipI family sensor histidine kinase inhibitor [Lacibacter cauensis]